MGRLIKEALFSNELAEEHRLRMHREADTHHASEEIEDFESPEKRWERLADRVKKTDPNGEHSYVLLQEVERPR